MLRNCVLPIHSVLFLQSLARFVTSTCSSTLVTYCTCIFKVYTFGNGSGVGKGSTDPRQTTPWLVESLRSVMFVDVTSGEGHVLALTQS